MKQAPSPDPSQIANRKSQIVAIPIVAGIGNAIMAEPMVRQLRDSGARVVVFAQTGAMGEIFRRIDGVEVVVTGSGVKKRLTATLRVRRLRADAYLVPFPSNRWQYNLLAAASGAKRVVMHGYPAGNQAALSGLHADRVPAERGLHDVVQNLRLLEPLGITPDYSMAPRFTLNDEERWQTENLPRLYDMKHAPFAVIHAGSAKTILAAAKRWPPEKYAQLAEEIARNFGLNVLIVEGPDEAGVARQIGDLTHLPMLISHLTFDGPIGDTAAFLSAAAFYVGTDSGLAHLAAAVGRRAVTLFAPADPDRVCPFGNRDLVVQPPGLKTPPFLYPWSATKPKLPAGSERLIQTITVEQVMQKVKQVAAEVLP